ncbi:hypothetical protein LX36DRAFT_339896 [Colletotrichum falcatum]|nr:hypothetical protein LX36DRAFT_339896 [Colletotrichum falcatum]
MSLKKPTPGYLCTEYSAAIAGLATVASLHYQFLLARTLCPRRQRWQSDIRCANPIPLSAACLSPKDLRESRAPTLRSVHQREERLRDTPPDPRRGRDDMAPAARPWLACLFEVLTPSTSKARAPALCFAHRESQNPASRV